MALHEIAADAEPRGADEHTDITVIIGTYQAAEHAEAGIERVLAQCGAGIELIVVDDASQDGTADQVRTLLSRSAARATLVVQPTNQGIAAARNLALRHARGEYVYFMDDDDEVADNALDSLLSAARQHDADIVLGQARRRVLTTGEVVPVASVPGPAVLSRQEAAKAVAAGQIQGHLWNKLFRRSVLGEDPFPLIRSKSDFGGVIRGLENSTVIVSTPDLVYTYLWRDGSISTGGTASPLDQLRMFERASAFLARERVSPEQRAQFRLWIVRSVRSELWRFGTRTSEAEIAEAYCRGLMDTRTVALIARSGHLSSSALAAGMAYAPRLVGAAYIRRRSGRLKKT